MILADVSSCVVAIWLLLASCAALGSSDKQDANLGSCSKSLLPLRSLSIVRVQVLSFAWAFRSLF